MSILDRRLHAFREDMADARLKGRVESIRFVPACTKTVISHFSDMLAEPSSRSSVNAQILHGEIVLQFDEADGYSWVQRSSDGYVGYVQTSTLGEPGPTPTHIVRVPRTFIYSAADLKLPRAGYLSMGSQICVVDSQETRGTSYAITSNGTAVIEKHLMPVGEAEGDFVSVAETLMHTPYLWGGNTGFGIDCSGLVQLAMGQCGRSVLRDSDMMMKTIGSLVETDPGYSNLQRGDLVFWNGHMGIMSSAEMLLHASGHSMSVAVEPLLEAVERIAYLYERPLCVRRP